MVRALFRAAVLLAVVTLVLAASAGADSSGASATTDPAVAAYVEEVPTASGTPGHGSSGAAASTDPAVAAYEEEVPTAGGSASGSSAHNPATLGLGELLTSPTLGAPQSVQPISGDASIDAYGTFSLQTVREVAGIGTARVVSLLAILLLISGALAFAAVTRLKKD